MNIELKPIKANFNTRQRQIVNDPTYNWFKMIKTNPYYLFPEDIEEFRSWKQWFKMINTKMRRYQNTYHSIKTHYPKH